MKLAVVGTGYVGLTLTCLADFGHEIVLIDKMEDKISMINKGMSPIFEPGLEDILKKNVKNGKITATKDYKKIEDCDVVFVCVGTPSNADGSIDLSQVKQVASDIGKNIGKKYKVIAVKSTVLPGTVKNVVMPILEKTSGKNAGKDFGVCMNPEFLKEGTGVHDFLNPDKIVIGASDDNSYQYLERVYESFDKKIPRVRTDLTTAEAIKYVQNAALAMKISFINEIANICEKFNVDVYEVAKAIGIDDRIGSKFLNAGIGFGGSCFPKDVKALLNAAKSSGVDAKILESIIKTNEKQPYRMIELAKQSIGDLKNKKIAILGLSFKPDTDDMREAPSIQIIKYLVEHESKVKVYDPKAMDNAKKIFEDAVEYCSSKEDCLKGTDLCMILTEWDEFKKMDPSLVKSPIIDGRRTLNPQTVKKHGLVYKGIGWKENFR